MSSTMLMTRQAATARKRRITAPGKRPFNQRAKKDLRRLLAALREIGDLPDFRRILQRYDVSEAGLKAFMTGIEVEMFVTESRYR